MNEYKNIDSTVKIGKNVEIGSGVIIGPYCVIGEDVKIGKDTRIGSHVHIETGTTIGTDNVIGNGCSLGSEPATWAFDHSLKTKLFIGDSNIISDMCVIVRSSRIDTYTRIGNHNIIASQCYIGHDCVVGDYVTVSNKATIAGYGKVGDYSTIGAESFIHQRLRIGEMCMIGACAKVVRDVPSYLLVDGIPAEARKINIIALQRHNKTNLLPELEDFYHQIYSKNGEIDIEKYSDEIRRVFLFIQNADRGITRLKNDRKERINEVK